MGGITALFGNKITYDGHVFQTEQIRVSKTVEIGLQYVEILSDFSMYVVKYKTALKELIGEEMTDEITSIEYLNNREFSKENAEQILDEKKIDFSLHELSIYSEQISFVIFLNELKVMGLITSMKDYNIKTDDFSDIIKRCITTYISKDNTSNTHDKKTCEIDNNGDKYTEIETIIFEVYRKQMQESNNFNVALNKMECLNLIPLMKVSKELELYNLLNNIFLNEISISYYSISYSRQSEARPSFENTVGLYSEFYNIYQDRQKTIDDFEKSKKNKLKQKNKVKR